MNENSLLNDPLIETVLSLLPPGQTAALMAEVMEQGISRQRLDTVALDALNTIDWDADRDRVGAVINRIMPLETLVPDVYHQWRPIVRDAVAFVGSRLSPERLAPKLVDQMVLPANLPLEQRLIVFISQMPSLQKIGQIVARDPNLDPAFRAELTRLENAIRDITPAEIGTEIERQLGPQLKTHRVKLDEAILAEASVSAVMPFTWLNPDSGQREAGVFKVLKPHVSEHFSEELGLLQDLAAFLEANRQAYALSHLNLREMLEDICHLLAEEVNFPHEQANLASAHRRYAHIPGVRVPRLIKELSTPTMTAMTGETSVKVTEAFADDPGRQRDLAQQIIEALLAVPLFAPAEEAMFHADPHAGNLFVDEQTGELVIFDWALTERLSHEQRRQLLLLLLGVLLRDGERIFHAIMALSKDNLRGEETRADIVRRQVTNFLGQLAPFSVPGVSRLSALLDDVLLSGVTFSGSIVILRKVLYTLEGVLGDVTAEPRLDFVLIRYALTQWLASFQGPCPLTRQRVDFHIPLSFFDWMALHWSARSFGLRLWLQAADQLRDGGLRQLTNQTGVG